MAEGRLIVLGSLNMDIVVTADRQPHPGETVFGNDVRFYPGGKGANQAVAAAKCGARTELIGAVGEDAFGPQILEFLRQTGVGVDAVLSIVGVPTGTASITVDAQGENSIIVVSGANGKVQVPEQYFQDRGRYEDAVVLAQFETPLDITERFFKQIRDRGGRTMLNPSPFEEIPKSLLAQCDVVIVNKGELARMTGTHGDNSVAAGQEALNLNLSDTCIIVTLGAKGCLCAWKNRVTEIAPIRAEVVDTTGAGDCFAGVFAALASEGRDYLEAARWANAAAALSTTKKGAAPSMPTMDEVREFCHSDRQQGVL